MTKIVAITGITGTLGKAVRRAFIGTPYADWSAYGCARKAPEDDSFITSIDVRHPNAVAQWLASLPRIDAVVTCAGLSFVHDSVDVAASDWFSVIDANLSGTFFAVREAIKCGATRAVTIGSIHGCTPTSYPMRAGYTASKAGVMGLTQALAVEFAHKGVACNCVAPGHLPVLMNGTGAGQALLDAATANTPLGRLATPEEVASVIFWLCNDAPVSMTGQILTIDGGFHMATFPLER